MAAQNPRVSVCIPNYNNGPYLAQAVESVLQQTVGDLEVIVCDNQSTDNSVEIARSFSDPRVRVYVNERNLGIYGNFKRTTELACGKYLKFLCADDWLDPAYLEAALAYFEQYPDAGLVTTRQVAVTNEGKVVTVRAEAVRGKEFYTPDEYFQAILRRINPIGNPTRVMVRRDAFDSVGGFDPTNEYAGDLDLWLRIAARYPVAAVPVTLCYERKHAAQMTHIYVKQATDIRDICLAFRKSFEDWPDFWNLERRIALCRQGLNPHAQIVVLRWLGGDRPYATTVTAYLSEISPVRYWLPYTVLRLPWIMAKVWLARLITRVGTRIRGTGFENSKVG